MTQSSFDELFGRPPTTLARAPGRVNLIGEHTDYNDGFVLPTAIPQVTRVELAVRADDQACLVSAGVSTDVESYRIGHESRRGGWIDYVQGLTSALAKRGAPLRGFDARIASNVPLGSGVSSSASLSIAILRALREAFAIVADDVALALLAQQSENDFVGAPVGAMDPMACSLCDEGTALFLDTRSMQFESVPIPEEAAIAVISSGVVHSHATGDYATRRRECEAAARALGVASLRDVDAGSIARLDALPELLRRRARHVVTENDRVQRAVIALRRGDLTTTGELFAASHASMRDDYEVSVPEIDHLVALAAATPGVFGARLTGGGFGGSVVILADAGRARDIGASVLRAYTEVHPLPARVLVPDLESSA